MEAWTEAELRAFAPRGREDYLQALANGWPDLQRAEINTPLRACWFIARWSEETGGFAQEIVENLNYKSVKAVKAAWPERCQKMTDQAIALTCLNNPQRLGEWAYGGREGNCEKGDGYAYRGRGFNQLTFRGQYRAYGERMGIDLETHPELAEQPAISLRIAIMEWADSDCNRFADRNNGRAVGNAINRGNAYSYKDPNGLEAQQAEFERAWAIWGDGSPTAGVKGIDKGDHGSKVELLQRKLLELGYQVGKPDGIYGPLLARAVVAFKHDYVEAHEGAELDPGSLVDQATWAAIDNAEPMTTSEERTNATEKDLSASTTITEAQRAKRMGTVLTGGGIITGAQQTGALDGVGDVVSKAAEKADSVNHLRHAFEPLIASVQWVFHHALWVAPIGIGVWLYAGGAKQIAEYVKRYRSGHILWR